jgi:hypothetical protein
MYRSFVSASARCHLSQTRNTGRPRDRAMVGDGQRLCGVNNFIVRSLTSCVAFGLGTP